MKNIIPKDLAEKLSSAARLRNLLVHRYWTIMDEKVYESIKNEMENFKNFVLYIKEFLSKDPVSNEAMDHTKLEFKYYELSIEEKIKLLNLLKEKLKNIDDILFAYTYGSFIEKNIFRDIDIAIWIKDIEKAFYYAVDFSAKLCIELKIPIDIQVLNEAPLSFAFQVLTNGKLLFSKNEELRFRIIDKTIRKYLDFKTLNNLC